MKAVLIKSAQTEGSYRSRRKDWQERRKGCKQQWNKMVKKTKTKQEKKSSINMDNATESKTVKIIFTGLYI